MHACMYYVCNFQVFVEYGGNCPRGNVRSLLQHRFVSGFEYPCWRDFELVLFAKLHSLLNEHINN